MLVSRKQLMSGLDVCEQLGMIGYHYIGNTGFVFGPVIIAFAEPRAGASKTGIGITGYCLPEITATSV
ncbi:hypothetical protein D3C81_1823600 [compost metagenome]